jgi:hypothetical protein
MHELRQWQIIGGRANASLTIGVIAAIASASATMTRRAYSMKLHGLRLPGGGQRGKRRPRLGKRRLYVHSLPCSPNAPPSVRGVSCVHNFTAPVVVARERALLAAHIGRGVDDDPPVTGLLDLGQGDSLFVLQVIADLLGDRQLDPADVVPRRRQFSRRMIPRASGSRL